MLLENEILGLFASIIWTMPFLRTVLCPTYIAILQFWRKFSCTKPKIFPWLSVGSGRVHFVIFCRDALMMVLEPICQYSVNHLQANFHTFIIWKHLWDIFVYVCTRQIEWPVWQFPIKVYMYWVYHPNCQWFILPKFSWQLIHLTC